MPVISEPEPSEYQNILRRPDQGGQMMQDRVREIIERVEQGGDGALRALSLEIEGLVPDRFEISRDVLLQSGTDVDDQLKVAIGRASENIRTFHRAQMPVPVSVETLPGIRCSLRYAPIERVGLYIPGGTAPLLSTVLMTVIPAKLAGCREIIACTPPGASPELLYTLGLFNIRVFSVGGAQAVAAMALGTESIPKVDKIFGPGNPWVTHAKMQLAGRGIAIDMPAGPSEVMVIADESAVPAYVAADLLSQAEHGPDSQVILLSDSMPLIESTLLELQIQIEKLPRKKTAMEALKHGMAICVSGVEKAVEMSNYYGPEHLILSVKNPNETAEKIHNAGSVFLGNYSPESAGDYASGTNHTLPTGGATRAWSGITIHSFMKSITLQELTREGLMQLAPTLLALSTAEQLDGHANAVLQRMKQNQ
ncbi:MAG: histidinol dehydrogenase [Bacteroidia bacterium]|nr:MAG: histidinol dehydrogenase [Bacteroidia bacterium]